MEDALGAAARHAGSGLKDLLTELVAGKLTHLVALDVGTGVVCLPQAEVPEGTMLLPGSFNPVHEGHEEMARRAAEMLGRSRSNVLLELCVVNADKGAIDVETLCSRLEKAVARGNRILASRATLFQHKADVFPGCVFVVGYDSYRRILDAKYYAPAGAFEGSSDEERQAWVITALQKLHSKRVSFVVAGRVDGDGFKSIETHSILKLPEELSGLFLALPDFRNDISSTALRAKAAHESTA
ncbi:unnamed protein product [Effrenium voratum]|uniref:Cytidyltransferase-like domain-containing protein n=1 Tax=Effrenium voratum TaxID=2562239 RepID=A0AA36NEY0_9DINO|nr:unnamed protein product [Effrenium voratum]